MSANWFDDGCLDLMSCGGILNLWAVVRRRGDRNGDDDRDKVITRFADLGPDEKATNRWAITRKQAGGTGNRRGSDITMTLTDGNRDHGLVGRYNGQRE